MVLAGERYLRSCLTVAGGCEAPVAPTRYGRCRRGTAIIEFALVAVLFLSVIFLSFNFFFWAFARAALQNAVREGVRYAATGQTDVKVGQDAAVRSVVKYHALGLLKSVPDSQILIQYYLSDGSGTAVSGGNSNAAGNIIVISVLNFKPATIAPIFGVTYPVNLSVRAVDRVEPFGGAPYAR
jgi:Flp pilus assembly protein TadG